MIKVYPQQRHLAAIRDLQRLFRRIISPRGLGVMLLYLYFVQPLPLLADTPLVTQEFRYEMPEAGEVYLVWGIDGWQLLPEEARPAGTFIENQVMHTLMRQEDGTFVAKLQIPVGTSLDYGFQTRKTKDGASMEWGWEGDHHLVATQDGLIEMKTRLVLLQSQTSGGSFDVGLLLLVGFVLILTFGPIVVLHRDMSSLWEQALSERRWLIYLRDLLRELVVRDMKLRYKRSLLGVGWSLINPLAQLLVLYLIFSLVIQLNIPNYPVFLFAGLLVWTWFQSSLFTATSVILENPDLIKRPGFPVAVLPVVTVTTHLIHFLLALPILIIFLLFSGIPLSGAMLVLPLVIALQFLLTLSLAYLVAALHVNFRDTQYLLGIFLLLGFYLSPIFYEASLIPERFQLLYRLNPMVDLIGAYRMILIQGELPDYLPLLVIAGLALSCLWAGYRLFVRVSYRFVEEL